MEFPLPTESNGDHQAWAASECFRTKFNYVDLYQDEPGRWPKFDAGYLTEMRQNLEDRKIHDWWMLQSEEFRKTVMEKFLKFPKNTELQRRNPIYFEKYVQRWAYKEAHPD